MLSFTFDGKDSYKDYGIIISKRPSIPSPKRKITYVNIPSRNSNLRFDENTFEDVTIAIECSVKSKLVPDKIDEIKSWLIGSGESDLIFSFQKEKRYIAQVINTIDFSQVLKSFSRFIVVFNCRPFKYEVNPETIELSESCKIINIGSYYSEPLIKIYGIGDIILKVNDVELNIKSLLENIILDSKLQNAYNDKSENLNCKVVGEIPIFKVGENYLSLVGNVSKVEITPNWRWI